MTDKNGKEIRTGDIVEITGAYFKSDNGLYLVTSSPGDPSWSGTGHCLHKIGKKGKISTATHNICFWPIGIFVNSHAKSIEARQWNKEHASIEVLAPLQNMSEVVAYFRQKADDLTKHIQRDAYHWGEGHDVVLKNKAIQVHYYAVARYVSEATV